MKFLVVIFLRRRPSTAEVSKTLSVIGLLLDIEAWEAEVKVLISLWAPFDVGKDFCNFTPRSCSIVLASRQIFVPGTTLRQVTFSALSFFTWNTLGKE